MKTKKIILIITTIVLFSLICIGLANLRSFGNPDSEMDEYFIKNSQSETGASNVVTAVVFDYRGFDTLGEASVLFASILGIALLLDYKRTRQKIKERRMSKIVTTSSKFIPAFSYGKITNSGLLPSNTTTDPTRRTNFLSSSKFIIKY